MSTQCVPIIVVIDGIIGSGKSVLIRQCLIPILTQKGWRVTEVGEPVDKWRTSGRLQQFYADPSRRGYQFQTCAFHDRIREAQEKYRDYRDSTDVFLLERSIFTDILFMKMLLESNTIDQTEYDDYVGLWTMWGELLPFKPDLFIYLKPDIQTCMKRLHERNREGEESVSKDYQQKLQQKHDEFLGEQFVAISDCHYVPRLLLETNVNFRDDSSMQEHICQQLESVLKTIRDARMSFK